MDSVFATALKARDKKKTQKRVRQKSTTGKLKRRKTELATFSKVHKEQMEDARTGKTYGAGVALAQVTKIAKAKYTAVKRNPKGTAPEMMREFPNSTVPSQAEAKKHADGGATAHHTHMDGAKNPDKSNEKHY